MDKAKICESVVFNRINLNKFKTNFLCVNFIIPLSYENAAKAALLAFVLKHGCKKYPSISAIACKCEELYGAELDISIRKKGDMQIISFYIDYVDSAYLPDSSDMNREAVEFLNSVIFEPLIGSDGFRAEIVENERNNLRDIINARRNNKTVYAVKRANEILTENSPHSIYEYGDINSLEQITGKDLLGFYNEFLRISSVQIFVIGNFPDNVVYKEFENRFNYEREPVSITNTSARSFEYKEVTETAVVEQAKLSLGFVFNDNGLQQSLITLFLLLFGASPNSLLFMNVREKLSLCYYCSATIEKFKNIMTVYSGVLPEKMEVAKQEILNQLDNIRNCNFSNEDFDAAKFSYLNSLNSIFDSAGSIEEAALAKALRNEEFDIEATIKEINSYSKEDVAEVAKRMNFILTYKLFNEVNQNE